ncbi:MAG: fumarate hydratase [Candidatus Omnitrophota bacterium]|nr:fumarate hydratase [Candidatus Omnitrophota bacterium]
MKTIKAISIRRAVADLCVKASIVLRPDVLAALKRALAREQNKRARHLLQVIIDNAACARAKSLAICQDTGMPVVFLEVGSNVKISGDLKLAVNRGVEDGYRSGCLRDSIVRDPLLRGKPGYAPAVIHIDIVPGSNLEISVLPKGFGSENKSQLKMFKPTVGIEEIKKFIIEAVRSAGPDACPPYIIGVGIGGTADYACLLAKKALLRKLTANGERRTADDPSAALGASKRLTAKLERELLRAINNLNIGPMGLGGKTTALAVHIETYPTHIAGLPVALNISCHALRSASIIL